MSVDRFWVFGPVLTMEGDEQWAVVDGEDLPGMRRATKPHGYSEFWETEQGAVHHAEYMNLRVEMFILEKYQPHIL